MDHTESKMASSVAERIPGETVNSASMFFTAGIDDEVYQSRSYTGITTRNSYTVWERYGLVEYYLLSLRYFNTVHLVIQYFELNRPLYRCCLCQ